MNKHVQRQKKKKFTKDFRGEEHYNESIDYFFDPWLHVRATNKTIHSNHTALYLRQCMCSKGDNLISSQDCRSKYAFCE